MKDGFNSILPIVSFWPISQQKYSYLCNYLFVKSNIISFRCNVMTVTAGTIHVVLVAASRWWRRIIPNFTAVASEDRQTDRQEIQWKTSLIVLRYSSISHLFTGISDITVYTQWLVSTQYRNKRLKVGWDQYLSEMTLKVFSWQDIEIANLHFIFLVIPQNFV